MRNELKYPSGKEFAFTILDDTDDTTVDNGQPVYEFLDNLGLRTTKTVWSFDTAPENRGPFFAGETLSSPEYRNWVHGLESRGFEIAFHNATMGSSLRQDTIKALDYLAQEFTSRIRIHCNHGHNRENLHWGAERYTSYLLQKGLGLVYKMRSRQEFEGSKPGSPYYWADVADERISYMRAFAFGRLNGANIPPGRPYCVPSKQQKTLFFNTADAPDIASFNNLVNQSSIDILREQQGWAIISTHLGKGFCRGNMLDSEFKENMEYLASLPGWFVPASQLLDFLKEKLGGSELSATERLRMEYSHILDRVYKRMSDSK